MGDDNALPPSKKRAAGREISRDNPGLDDELDVSDSELGTFKKADNEVLASRRIIKVRRKSTAPSLNPTAPSSNPFAGIRLVPPVLSESRDELQANAADERATAEVDGKADINKETDGDPKAVKEESEEKSDKTVYVPCADQKKVGGDDKSAEDESMKQQQTNGEVENEAEARAAGEKAPEIKGEETDEARTVDDQGKAVGDDAVNEDEKRGCGNGSKDDSSTDVGSQTTSFSSFQQLSSNTNAFTGLAGTGFSSSFSFGSVSKDGSASIPAFGFGTSSNGTTLFSAAKSSENKNEGVAFPPKQEVSVQTGEENEDTVFTADSTLFEFVDGGWKERGKGELKLNISNTGVHMSRLVMRARGNYRLILNASLYPDIKLTRMEKKGITFACVNSATEGKSWLATFALKFKDSSLVETFSAAVASHKGEAGTAAPAQEPPENSPKSTDEV